MLSMLLSLALSMTDSDYDEEGSGLEMVHISDVLDYLGKINVKIYDETTWCPKTLYPLCILQILSSLSSYDKSFIQFSTALSIKIFKFLVGL